jgi:hypothetical protein
VPVTASDGKFVQARPQDTYSRELDFRHTYEVPRQSGMFAWKSGYSFLRNVGIRAQRFFAIEGRLDGLGYMVNSDGVEVAAPVVVADHTSDPSPGSAMRGSRMVALAFEPEPGYWESQDGISLISATAGYARQGATSFWLETACSTLKPVKVHRLSFTCAISIANVGESLKPARLKSSCFRGPPCWRQRKFVVRAAEWMRSCVSTNRSRPASIRSAVYMKMAGSRGSSIRMLSGLRIETCSPLAQS